MPIYEYQCDECGHQLDALQGVNDEPLLECPECAKTSLKRLISAPNFRLKGQGWYETDFKKENRKNVADNKDEKSDKKESSDDDKSPDQSKKKEKKKDKAAKDAE